MRSSSATRSSMTRAFADTYERLSGECAPPFAAATAFLDCFSLCCRVLHFCCALRCAPRAALKRRAPLRSAFSAITRFARSAAEVASAATRFARSAASCCACSAVSFASAALCSAALMGGSALAALRFCCFCFVFAVGRAISYSLRACACVVREVSCFDT